MDTEYAVLAPIYDRIGLAAFAKAITPKLLDYVQRHEWMGRRILDIGCGTGASLYWFGKRTYSIYGVDSSAEMLHHARATLATGSLNPVLSQQDLRQLQNLDSIDLAIALDVVNSLDSLRDFEAAFKSVHRVLDGDRLFVFDLHTIEGLAQQGEASDTLFFNADDLTVFLQTRFDYERQALTRHYVVFRRDETGQGAWIRQDAYQTLRAYPVQAVAALLQRSGFQVDVVLNEALTPYDPAKRGMTRVFFVARKR